MSGPATPGTPDAGNEPAGAAPTADANAATSGAGTAVATPPVTPEPDIYDVAFDDFMGPDAKDPDTAPSSEMVIPKDPPAESQPAAESQEPGKEPGGAAEPSQLTADQVQTLKRQHIEPEMVAGWTDAQKVAFFQNADKREADQTSSYQQMSQRLDNLAKRVEQGGTGQEPQAGQNGEGEGNPQVTFAAEATRVSDQLVQDFGPEIGDAGKLMISMGDKLDQAMAQLEATGGRVQTSETSTKALNEVIVELTLDSAISGLVGQYPSLSKDAVRQQVLDKFETDWKTESSPHRKGKGPILSRVKKAVADAAKFELGTTNESAAQVALVNKNKERLKQQPTPGHGKGQARPKTEDEIYDQAFQETLGAEMKR